LADSSGLPAPRKMLRLTVIIKARDSFQGKPIVDILLSLYKQAGISGATVTHAARGYGARGVARVGKLLPEIHRMVGSNGLITTEEVSVY